MKWGWLLLAGCASQPTPFELDFHGTPALFAYKADGGAWQTPKPYVVHEDATGFQLPDADAYEIFAVCEYDRGIDAAELRVTRDELDAVAFLPTDCLPFATTLSGELIDYGSVDQIPAVSAFHVQSGVQVASYKLAAEAAVQDVVIFNRDRIIVLRDQDLRTDLGEPTIDFGTSGSPIQAESFAYTPADPDETLAGYTDFITNNRTDADWTMTPGSVYIIPSDAQIVGDETWAGLVATSTTTTPQASRSTSARLGDQFPDQLTWLPRLTNVTFDAASYTADWAPFADAYSMTSLGCSWGSPGYSDIVVFQSVAWSQRYAPTTTTLDTDIPGWRWTIPASRTCQFGVSTLMPSSAIEMASYVDVN